VTDPVAPERVDQLEKAVHDLEERLAAITPHAVGDDVIYRPPLWTQPAAFSAADDRRLILSAFMPGVVDFADLKVTQRAEGANLSVDVAPGHVVVEGTDQADQGRYLSPLAQRRNIPLLAGPSAGSHRQDQIVAVVHDDPNADPPWEVVALRGVPGPTNLPPPNETVDQVRSFYRLATVGPIHTNTNQITNQMIFDWRKLARPASTGAIVSRAAGIFPYFEPGPLPQMWGSELITYPPYGQPVDIEYRFTGLIHSRTNAQCLGAARVGFTTGAAGDWNHISAEYPVGSMNNMHYAYFAVNGLYNNLTLTFPQRILFWCQVRQHSGAQSIFSHGFIHVRITPSGTALTS